MALDENDLDALVVVAAAILDEAAKPFLAGHRAQSAVAKKGNGKARAPAAPVTAATVIASDMPVLLVAPGTVGE